MNRRIRDFSVSRTKAKQAASGLRPWKGTAETRPPAVPQLSLLKTGLVAAEARGKSPVPLCSWIGWAAILATLLLSISCSRDSVSAATKANVNLEPGVFEVNHPELFKLAKAETRELATVLTANGSVNPDVTRTIHVTSMGSGRVVDLKVRLGDSVRKGQVLLVISSQDLSGAMADYQKARADEDLSHKALDRAQELYEHGAFAAKDLEVAQTAEQKSQADLLAASHRVRLLGGDPDHPSTLIDLRAPVSGTIVEQNVAGFEGVKSLDNSANLFTIADLSQVWVVCDVYENDLGQVHLGDSADVRLNAFPDRVFKGHVADISRVLDPNTRSAKVRIVLANKDGSLRPGMFARATFRSRKLTPRLVVPATAVMRLHDKDWLFCKEGPNRFRRMEVRAGETTPDGFSAIEDGGVKPGLEVMADALQFSTEVAESK